MPLFDYATTLPTLMTPEIVRLMTSIAGYRGRQSLRLDDEPTLALRLSETARIRSVDASNRIEGIHTSDDRLRQLVAQTTEPRNRSEQEIAGYRLVLDEIREGYAGIPVTPDAILKMHRDLYRYTEVGPTAGRFKASDNVIVERNIHGELVTRFVPVSARDTPHAVKALCDAYARTQEDEHSDSLLLAAVFAFDFVSIHPFSDGNGRLSRLLFTLLLLKEGFNIARFVSLEQEIERTKGAYYDALWASSREWKSGNADHQPIVAYQLGVVQAAYEELGRHLDRLGGSQSNEEKLRAYFADLTSEVSKREILEANPVMSEMTLTRLLQKLQADGTIEKVGAARATAYRTRREP